MGNVIIKPGTEVHTPVRADLHSHVFPCHVMVFWALDINKVSIWCPEDLGGIGSHVEGDTEVMCKSRIGPPLTKEYVQRKFLNMVEANLSMFVALYLHSFNYSFLPPFFHVNSIFSIYFLALDTCWFILLTMLASFSSPIETTLASTRTSSATPIHEIIKVLTLVSFRVQLCIY